MKHPQKFHFNVNQIEIAFYKIFSFYVFQIIVIIQITTITIKFNDIDFN